MRQQDSIAVATFLTAISMGLVIWFVAGPPPHSPKPVNAHQFVISVK
jgi:hypothetical protein